MTSRPAWSRNRANGSGQAPPRVTGGAWPFRLAADGSRYRLVSTALSTKDATAPFARPGALGLVLHWPF
jgi:hypothetical protein